MRRTAAIVSIAILSIAIKEGGLKCEKDARQVGEPRRGGGERAKQSLNAAQAAQRAQGAQHAQRAQRMQQRRRGVRGEVLD